MLSRISEYVSLIKVKFYGIFTSVFVIKLDTGYALFDSATYDEDVENTIMPAVKAAGITPDEIRFLFISHSHSDHFGGAAELLRRLPRARLVISDLDAAQRLGVSDRVFRGSAEEHSPLRIIELCGHTDGCIALYDSRTRTLLSADAIQLFGVDRWGTGISDVDGYLSSLARIREMDVELLVASHEYYPLGQTAIGRGAVRRYLTAAEESVCELIELTSQMGESSHEECASLITERRRVREQGFPTQSASTVRAIREYLKKARN